MYAPPTRLRNGTHVAASRMAPMSNVEASMESVQSLVQMLLGQGIDSSVPAPGHTGSKVRLPLQYFDNTDLERNTPQGWVEQCTRTGKRKASAIVLITDESGVGQWRLARVFRWDAASSTFHAHPTTEFGLTQEDSSVALQRLSVCFLAEPMSQFAERVAAAQHVHSGTLQGGTLSTPTARRANAAAPAAASLAERLHEHLPAMRMHNAHAHAHAHTHARRPHIGRATKQRRSCSSAST